MKSMKQKFGEACKKGTSQEKQQTLKEYITAQMGLKQPRKDSEKNQGTYLESLYQARPGTQEYQIQRGNGKANTRGTQI